MTFVYDNNDNVESFAEFQDVLDHDQRLFDTNEGLSDSTVYPFLIRSTERILSKIQGSDWWKSVAPGTSISPEYIISRHNDFTDLCIYFALSEYILPIIADFGTTDNAEIQKLKYYSAKWESLLNEIISSGDWYDFDGDGNINPSEVKPGTSLRRRIR